MVDRKSEKAVRVVVMEEVSCCFKLFDVSDDDASSLFLVAKRVERAVVTGTFTPLDAWNACEKGSDKALMMIVAVKEADLMVIDILTFFDASVACS